MTQPVEVTQAVDVIVAAFSTVQERLEAEYAAILTNPAKAARARRIRGVAAMISRQIRGLEDTAGRWVADQVPKVYELGANATELGFTFTQFHRQAVQVLQDDMYDDVLAATRFMSTDSKRWIRDASRILAAEGHVEGVAPRDLARRFARMSPRAIDRAGLPMPITAARYSDGSMRTIDDYADMLFRTKTAAAHNAGTINRSRELGIDRFEIRDGPGCKLRGHGEPGPDDAHGKAVDAETAAAYPLSHPNCRRVFLARPDLPNDSPTEPVPEGTPPGPVPLPDPPTSESTRRPRAQRQQRTLRSQRRSRGN
ncbi:MAG: hypothetical protein AAF567_24485 [Actinomycetota bacterium]